MKTESTETSWSLGIENKHAWVMAASKGLGRASAMSLAEGGVRLTLVARSETDLLAAAEEARRRGAPQVAIHLADLSNQSDRTRLEELMREDAPDILVNNTGGPPPSIVTEITMAQWQAGYDSLFASAVQMSQAALQPMRERGFGRIITISSIAAVEPIRTIAVSSAFRAALTNYFKLLADEAAPWGVTANVVLPGVIHTGRIEALRRAKAAREGTTFEKEMAQSAAEIPMRRMGRPEELGDVVAFLASARASYVTGAVIPVDGGLRKRP